MKRALGAWFVAAAMIAACSSSSSSGTGSTDGGTADGASSDGATSGDATTGDGGPSDCPTSAPSAGDPCAKVMTCTYGTCGIVTDATCDGKVWSVSKAGINCAGDAAADSGGYACGEMDDAGMQHPGACTNGDTCCSGGAVGTYYCTNTDGGACPQVP